MSITVDAHADTMLKLYLSGRNLDMLGLPTELQVTGEKMISGNLNLEIFAVFIAPYLEERAGEVALEMIHEGKDFLASEKIELITNSSGLVELDREGGTGGVLSLEGALPLGEKATNLEGFRDRGIRLLTLTWSRSNAFASGVGGRGDQDDGLTAEGRYLLELASQLGVVIDISHLNPRGVRDVLELSDMPVIASHSCAYHVHPHARNLTDEQIEAISSTGGVVGVNFYTAFLNGTREAGVRDVADHIDHIVELGGISSVGIGSDFDGISTFPKDLEDVSKLGNLRRKLERTYSRSDLEAIMGENFRRVLEKVWN